MGRVLMVLGVLVLNLCSGFALAENQLLTSCADNLKNYFRFTPEQIQWIESSQFHAEGQKEVLDLIEEEVKTQVAAGVTPYVAFDLDETGLDNRHAMYGAIHGENGWLKTEAAAKYPEVKAVLEALDFSHTGESATETFFHAKLPTDTEAYKEFNAFWKLKFFSNEFIGNYAHAFAGFVEYITKLHSLGAHVVYLTARNEPNQGDGTRKALRTLNLLMDERTTLIMKQDKGSTVDYKTTALGGLIEKGHVVGMFDNDAEVIVALEAKYQQVKFVFVQTHFEKIPGSPAQNLYRINGWNR